MLLWRVYGKRFCWRQSLTRTYVCSAPHHVYYVNISSSDRSLCPRKRATQSRCSIGKLTHERTSRLNVVTHSRYNPHKALQKPAKECRKAKRTVLAKWEINNKTEANLTRANRKKEMYTLDCRPLFTKISCYGRDTARTKYSL